MIRNRKGLGLLELVIVMVASAILIASASGFIVFMGQFSVRSRVETSLQQEALIVSEHISANLRKSKYVDMTNTGLKVYDKDSVLIGSYGIPDVPTVPPSTKLWYDDGTEQTLVSDKIDFANTRFADVDTGSTSGKTKALNFTVTVADPRFSNIGSKSLAGAVYCRVSGFWDRVRLVAPNGTTEIGKFGTIQGAINDVRCVDGCTIQVYCNGKIAYRENVTNQVGSARKIIKLEGAYDALWAQHLDDDAYETIIDGNYAGWVIDFQRLTSSTANFSVRGFTIMNGRGDGGDEEWAWVIDRDVSVGPGISMIFNGYSGSVDISHNKIKDNKIIFDIIETPWVNSYYVGGGISLDTDNTSTVKIYQNTISGNNGSTGGGIYVSGKPAGTKTLEIYQNTITGNTANWVGGGIFSANGRSAVYNNTISYNSINDVVIGYNQTKAGGGVWIGGYGDCILANNIIEYNESRLSTGGVYACNYYPYNPIGFVTVSNNIIRHNTALKVGGILCVDKITVINNEISDNVSTGCSTGCLAGGIYAAGNSTAIPIIKNNIISNNKLLMKDSPDAYGGGIYYATCNYLCAPEITGNTITGNGVDTTTSTSYGGGICFHCEGSLAATSVIKQNLVIDNKCSDGGGMYLRTNYTGQKIDLFNNVITGSKAEFTNNGGGIFIEGGDALNAKIRIINNVVANNIVQNNGAGIYVKRLTAAGEVDIYSSIVYYNDSIATANDCIFTYNTAYKPIVWRSCLSLNESLTPPSYYLHNAAQPNIYANPPNFVDKDNGNFKLNLTSPCKDTGYSAAGFYDLPGVSPYTSPATPPSIGTRLTDMGAYGGPNTIDPIGAVTPLASDNTGTSYIREDKLGTYTP